MAQEPKDTASSPPASSHPTTCRRSGVTTPLTPGPLPDNLTTGGGGEGRKSPGAAGDAPPTKCRTLPLLIPETVRPRFSSPLNPQSPQHVHPPSQSLFESLTIYSPTGSSRPRNPLLSHHPAHPQKEASYEFPDRCFRDWDCTPKTGLYSLFTRARYTFQKSRFPARPPPARHDGFRF